MHLKPISCAESIVTIIQPNLPLKVKVKVSPVKLHFLKNPPSGAVPALPRKANPGTKAERSSSHMTQIYKHQSAI
jgi:hypothetical protein